MFPRLDFQAHASRFMRSAITPLRTKRSATLNHHLITNTTAIPPQEINHSITETEPKRQTAKEPHISRRGALAIF
jgi:hypothetical protein